ncbi:MAG: 50S ribosomal protein L21 [Bacteroidales bacterium]|jgi:large subunit ribosomal protein L21|nr:50S ribosomal protein L21 [Bacteroidales bacterium]NCU37102.1 50S ribosomal protein L21 [Candidatus Falkowbacteria bacterium]MDD2633468.1 50S ribosomal protein L21 [Bacteroidales bacterium]MDD3130438.1 50S ribosomal protein L21 [Bacteroidales bacterium]MDD3526975.1 50S ribosomal protein L21 [Bacteroidales bacterium]
MYAIVDIAGQQFKIEKDKEIFVHRQAGEAGDTLSFGSVMLVGNGESISVGKPFVEGAKVEATILEHLKGDKVLIFKKKRRKGYQKENGHRQQFTKVKIENIAL